ncbi:ABC transporter permease subunit [Pseudofrankia asymbiotica]|uniref:ABC transporter permease n=1 Tax=Pseudofrankia asymbiotica TaxID=1834516 RepID=A0A1V2I6J4_9ACTN|nr:ABC transporter permease subunit [Pseudofrankia asymbiotica]ONH26964.1 hypothetical protein BL253_23220 [Pseudofrankia asymbiotica]
MSAFVDTLRAEWTKFRTIRGWVIGTVAIVGVIVAFGLMPGMQGSCGKNGPGSECSLPVGPGGEEVTDTFTFLHQALTGDGEVIARVAGMTGIATGEDPDKPNHTVEPWAKAGLIIRAATDQGSSYAAVMVTGGHGVRMQYDYTHDVAGSPDGVTAAVPRWLRLTRAGDTVTAAESVDGDRWTTVGTARLRGLPPTVEVGLFATSPQHSEELHTGLMSGAMGGPTQVTGTFDHLAARDGWTGAAWHPDVIGHADGPANGAPGAEGPPAPASGVEQVGDAMRLTGSGDIAPAVSGSGGLGVSITQTLVGTFVGLILAVVVGTVFVTAEYRRGLVRTTFAASPGRLRVLAAKATVVGGVMFVTGLAAAAATVVFGQRVLRGNGVYVHSAPAGTEVRVVVGTAVLLAVAAILGLGLGALLRRGVTAVTTAVLVIVLPYLLAMTVLTGDAARWLLRVSPAAAFALQQASPEYPQVANLYTPADGYFPLAPWAGFAVLTAWAAVALAAAAVTQRRRDA